MWKREATCTPRSTEENVGCMQGIFNMFYVYPSSGTRKLLSDGPRRSKWYLKKKSKPKLLTSVDDKREGSNCDGQCESGQAKLGSANVNTLKKGRASKQVPDTRSQPLVPDIASTSHLDKNLKKRNKNSGVHTQKANNESIGSSSEPHQSRHLQQDEGFSNDIHVDALLEGLYNNTHKSQQMHANSKNRIHLYSSEGIRTSEMFGSLEQHDVQLPQDDPVLERTLDEVLENIILNKVVNPNQPTASGATNQSEELKNVLETLRSSKDLLLEVLQDPKIVNLLLVKHVDNPQNSAVTIDQPTAENELSENKIGAKQSERPAGHFSFQKPKIHDSFLEDESKSSRPSKESENSQNQGPNRIVILKPNLVKDQGSSDINEPISPSYSSYSSSPNRVNEVVSFHSISQEIKRKLKQVFGMSQRQRHLLSSDEVCYKLPSDSQALNDFSDTSEYLKADDLLGPSGVKQEALLPSENRARSVESQLCTEPELLFHIDGNNDEHLDTRKESKSLEDVIYIPDYVIAPGIDLIKDKMPILPPQQMTYSPTQSPTQESVLNRLVQSRMQSETLDHNTNSSNAELQVLHLSSEVVKIHTQAVVITGETTIPKDFVIPTIEGDEPDAKNVCANIIAKTNSKGTVDVPEEKYKKDDYSSWSSLDLFEELSHLESPAVPSAPTVVNQKFVTSDDTGKPERPSAASMRESLLLDKVIKLRSCKSIHVTNQFRISPRKPRFQQYDDSVINVTTSNPETSLQLCVRDDDFKFEYMKALLEASDFCHSIAEKREKTSTNLLDPSLYDEVETPSGEIPDDLKLFFDCIGEVLEEIYKSSSSFMPLLSFINSSLRPFPSGEKLIQEAWRVLNIYFIPWLPTTLEKTIKKDLEIQTWMDIRCSVEEISVALGNDIFDKILEETILELWD